MRAFVSTGIGIGALRLSFWFRPLHTTGGAFVLLALAVVWMIKVSIGVAMLEVWALYRFAILIADLIIWCRDGIREWKATQPR